MKTVEQVQDRIRVYTSGQKYYYSRRGDGEEVKKKELQYIEELPRRIANARSLLQNCVLKTKEPSVSKHRSKGAIRHKDLWVRPAIALTCKGVKVPFGESYDWTIGVGADGRKSIPHILRHESLVRRFAYEPSDFDEDLYEVVMGDLESEWEAMKNKVDEEVARQVAMADTVVEKYHVETGDKSRAEFRKRMGQAIRNSPGLRGQDSDFLLRVMKLSYYELTGLASFATKFKAELHIVDVADVEAALSFLDVQEVMES